MLRRSTLKCVQDWDHDCGRAPLLLGPLTVVLMMSSSLELLLAAQRADRVAEVGLDAVRLLEALAQQSLDERPVLATTCRGEVDLEPGCELGVFRQRGDVDDLLDPRDGDLV